MSDQKLTQEGSNIRSSEDNKNVFDKTRNKSEGKNESVIQKKEVNEPKNENTVSLIQTLHSYENFQKKYINSPGKSNPYKKKENKLTTVRKKIARIFSSCNIDLYSNTEKKNEGNKKFLTSRVAMWNEVEKHDNPNYNLTISSYRKRKSIHDFFTNNLSLLLHELLYDKRGVTYIASVMIILSIIITCVSAILALIRNSQSTIQTQTENKTPMTNSETHEYMNQIMDSLNVEPDSNQIILQQLLDQIKSMLSKTTHGNNAHLLNSDDQASLVDLSNNVEIKLKELERKLTEHTNEMVNIKRKSNKEIEDLKKRIEDSDYLFEYKMKNYIKHIDSAIPTDEMNEQKIWDAMENKINRNKLEIKNDLQNQISTHVSYEKIELLNRIDELQKKINIMEEKLNLTNEFSPPIHIKQQKKIYKNESNNINENEQELEMESLWKTKEVLLIKLQKELEQVKRSVGQSTNALDNLFPTIEKKMASFVETKIKLYFDNYKKEIIKEFAKSKLDRDEKFKFLEVKQSTLQNELIKTMQEQISMQTKLMKEDIYKTLQNDVTKGMVIGESSGTVPSRKITNVGSLDDLQKKVEELYNEFILDYNQIDWALESLGAKIVYKMTSTPLNKNDWIEKLINHIAHFLPSEEIYGMVKPMGKDPSIILKPSNYPGDCFSFQGERGKITIHLPATIDVTSISIQHVHENISNNPNATPKYFSVYGIVDTNWPEKFESSNINLNDFKNLSLYNCLHSTYGNLPAKEILDKWLKDHKEPPIIHIGDFYFDRKRRIATYPTKHCFPFKRIIFEFSQNYGANYTCVYRLKVHGKRCIRKTNEM